MQTLSKEESYLSDNAEESDIATLKTETATNNQEKEALEKSKKEMANVKRAGKRCCTEKDAVMSRYGA